MQVGAQWIWIGAIHRNTDVALTRSGVLGQTQWARARAIQKVTSAPHILSLARTQLQKSARDNMTTWMVLRCQIRAILLVLNALSSAIRGLSNTAGIWRKDPSVQTSIPHVRRPTHAKVSGVQSVPLLHHATVATIHQFPHLWVAARNPSTIAKLGLHVVGSLRHGVMRTMAQVFAFHWVKNATSLHQLIQQHHPLIPAMPYATPIASYAKSPALRIPLGSIVQRVHSATTVGTAGTATFAAKTVHQQAAPAVGRRVEMEITMEAMEIPMEATTHVQHSAETARQNV
jgi:hypothetical protein